jgi:hypothetical protein
MRHVHHRKSLGSCQPPKRRSCGVAARRNVQVICEEYNIPLVETREELTEHVVERLKRIIKERASE